jgi:hypothetical protein
MNKHMCGAWAGACGCARERVYWRNTGHKLIKRLSSLVLQRCVAADMVVVLAGSEATDCLLRSRGKGSKTWCVARDQPPNKRTRKINRPSPSYTPAPALSSPFQETYFSLAPARTSSSCRGDCLRCGADSARQSRNCFRVGAWCG